MPSNKPCVVLPDCPCYALIGKGQRCVPIVNDKHSFKVCVSFHQPGLNGIAQTVLGGLIDDITVAGFETTDRRDFFDLAIGNVPFGQYQVNDRAYNRLGFSIHNYFFAKALDQVRPGGVVAFVTSRYTMDAKDSAARKYIAQRADLLGAIRLPNNAFKANAGTDVVSDIIFLQKRDRPIDIEPDWVHLGANADGFSINQYFIDNPEMVLGRQTSESTQYGRQDFTVEPYEDLDLATQLRYAIQNIGGKYEAAELPDLGENEAIQDTIPADPNVKNYSYAVVDGEVYYRENSVMVKPNLNATAKERVKGMAELRDCVHRLIDLQMWESDDLSIRAEQQKLNRLYDRFTEKYGLINSRGNALAFADDSSYYLLCSLEMLDDEDKTKLKGKADMFTKRTIRQRQSVTSVDTAAEALALSIGEKARVDMAYMSQLTGKSEDDIIDELNGVIFLDPVYGDWQTADEYLSGNVRQKLREAEKAAVDSPGYLPNVEALRAAQPKDLDASEIEVRLGATWIDKKYIQQFMFELLEPPLYARRSLEVNYSEFTAEWNISGKNSIPYNDINARMTYGTDCANAYKILEDTLNLRDVRIYDTIRDADGKEKRVLNSKETTLAQQKQQAIKEAFRDWIWRDPDRRRELVQLYNERFNSTRPREYDGRHLIFPGMNPEITLREHQLNAIAHDLYGGNTLLAHEVGAGKTFEMIAAAMEGKRLGLCQKSLFAVPNHLTEQWASEFLRLYPSANILVATKKDFETRNRKKFCARIATGDYDAVIIGHSQFERIPVSRERQERLLQEQIWEIEDGISELKASRAERFTIKELERTKKNLETRLQKLHDAARKDDVVTFEQLGVDRLYVDEAHSFKNLFLYTKMRNVAGLSTTDAQKSSDMLLKCRYIDEITHGKGVTFATGTPISNSMTELYTMMRYLQHDMLKRNSLTHFDCWASAFGETTTAIELAPEGTGYRARTRFAKFFNLPELMNLFREAADIKTADQLNLPTPTPVYHNEVSQPTALQKQMVQELSERAAKVHAGSVDASTDNMLKITSDGRKLGLDQRVINPDLPDDPGSKVNRCVDNIHRIWQDGQADKLTQLVFCDLSTPKGKTAQSGRIAAKGTDSPELHALEAAIDAETEPEEPPFTIYDDIREKLVARGIPREQIAFIHEANTETRKKELFAKVRSGQVRVLMGSTFKMGAGMNVQDRLVALHDLDCPWRPGDLEQRSGRIIRQGNRNKEVHIYRYVTESTFDAYLWQTVENKQKFISQIMTSKSPVRSCEDTVKYDTAGGTSIGEKTGVRWEQRVLDGVEPPTRTDYEFRGWSCSGKPVFPGTTYADLAGDKNVQSITLTAQWAAAWYPEGEIKIEGEDTVWNGFESDYSARFYNTEQTVTISAPKSGGKPVEIGYLITDEDLTKARCTKRDFTPYTEPLKLNTDGQHIVYAKLTNAEGNVTYLRTTGRIVIDTTPPEIVGIEDGKTYYRDDGETITAYPISDVTAIDMNLDSFSVNGKPISISGADKTKSVSFSAPYEESCTYKFIATDKAGNVTEKTVNLYYNDKVVSVTGVSLNESSITLDVGGSKTLAATVTPENATNKKVRWTSDNETVATVSEDGVVTAVAGGTAVITATTHDGLFTASCTVTVNAPDAAPSITTDTLPNGKVGEAYSQTLTATGTAPITWSIDGGLPAGLSLNADTGEISGTPTADGTAKFTVKATNSAGSNTKELSIMIAKAAPAEYTVTVTSGGNGTASASPAKAAAGTEITLTATPNTGYHFKEWQVISGNVTIKDDKFLMPDSNVEVKAIFEEDAPPAPTEHTVTVTSSGNGTASASPAKAVAGAEITLSATPDKGYHLKEWQVISGGVSIKDNKFTMPNNNVEIKAIFEKDAPPTPTEYTVTVTTEGGGTASASPAKAVAGAEITLTATPNTGYHFKEWQVISGGVTIKDDKFTMPSANVEVKAIFEKDAPPAPTDPAKPNISVTGTYTYNGSVHTATVNGYDPATMDISGNTATDAGDYTVRVTSKTGKWVDGSTDAVTAAWSIGKATQEAPNGLTGVAPTEEGGDGKITGVDATMEYRAESETIYIACIGIEIENLSAGNYFVRYAEDHNHFASPDAEVTVGEGTSLADCTITFNAGGGSGSMDSVTVKAGANYILPECGFTAPADQEFKAWEIGGTEYKVGDSYTVNGDIEIKALWKNSVITPTTYTVTVSNDGNGTGTATPSTAVAGTEIILTATPNTGYHLKEWKVISGGVTIKDDKFLMPNDNVEVRAIFEEDAPPVPTEFTITVKTDGNGTVSASHAKAVVGTEITLIATPKTGYHFKEWEVMSGGVTISNNKFTMPNGNVTIKAIFEEDAPPAPAEFTVIFDGNGGMPSVGSMTTTNQKLTSLPSASRSGSYSFDGWYTEKSGGTKITTATVFSAKTTVYAHWTYTGGGGGGYNPPVTYYTLRFETGGGSDVPSVQGTYNTYIDLTKYVPTWRGHTFIGWYSERSLMNKVSGVYLTKDMTVYAGWRVDENPGTGANPFTDVSEKDWFYGDVMFVYENGLMLGTSKALFSPHGTATRGMMATILWRMEGSPVPKGKNSFTDVEAGKWYADAITWTAENGIFAGYGKDKFGPDDPITREQLAAIFYRYADYKGYDLIVKGNLDKFKDADKITDYAKTAMQWAVGSGLVKGKSGNLLDPQGTATRAEIAAMLHRFIEKYELVQGKAPGGLMGWIDPKRLQIPKTGDSSVLGLWGISLCTSLAGCLALTTWQIRRRREEEALQIIEK